MKKLSVILLLSLTTSCMTTHRHPVITKIVLISAGAVGGVTAYKLTHHTCAGFYDGKRYDGTPPCPQ